jgi:hypothetical protein
MFFQGATIDQNVVYVDDHKSSNHSRKMSFMKVQNVVGALVNPKGITMNSYEPYLCDKRSFLRPLSQSKFDNIPNVGQSY